MSYWMCHGTVFTEVSEFVRHVYSVHADGRDQFQRLCTGMKFFILKFCKNVGWICTIFLCFFFSKMLLFVYWMFIFWDGRVAERCGIIFALCHFFRENAEVSAEFFVNYLSKIWTFSFSSPIPRFPLPSPDQTELSKQNWIYFLHYGRKIQKKFNSSEALTCADVEYIRKNYLTK